MSKSDHRRQGDPKQPLRASPTGWPGHPARHPSKDRPFTPQDMRHETGAAKKHRGTSNSWDTQMKRGRHSEPGPDALIERAKGSARHFFMRQLIKSAAVGFPGGLLAALFLRHRGFPIFMFHRVLPGPRASYDPEMVISTDLFESFLQWASEKFQIVSVPELMRRIKEPLNGDRRYCSITFDDGWQDNYAYAFPLLQAYHAPATIFLAARLIGSKRRFWQERLWACLNVLDGSVINDGLAEEFNRQYLWYPLLRPVDFKFSNLRRVLLKRSSREAEEFVDLLETKIPCPGAPPGR